MLGLDILHSLTLSLDYRDGLAKFEPANGEFSPGRSKGMLEPSTGYGDDNGSSECQSVDLRDRPLNSTIEATVTGTMESVTEARQRDMGDGYPWVGSTRLHARRKSDPLRTCDGCRLVKKPRLIGVVAGIRPRRL